MSQIFLALGSNVGDRKKYIEEALVLLEEQVLSIKRAPIYETKPWGCENQGNFLNAVLKGKTKLSPIKLLVFIKNIEKKIGRVKRFKNGPREIDIDILFYDQLIYKDQQLQIPHPGIMEREFVLRPFCDIAPNFVHPVAKKTIKQLLKEIPLEKRLIV